VSRWANKCPQITLLNAQSEYVELSRVIYQSLCWDIHSQILIIWSDKSLEFTRATKLAQNL